MNLYESAKKNYTKKKEDFNKKQKDDQEAYHKKKEEKTTAQIAEKESKSAYLFASKAHSSIGLTSLGTTICYYLYRYRKIKHLLSCWDRISTCLLSGTAGGILISYFLFYKPYREAFQKAAGRNRQIPNPTTPELKTFNEEEPVQPAAQALPPLLDWLAKFTKNKEIQKDALWKKVGIEEIKQELKSKIKQITTDNVTLATQLFDNFGKLDERNKKKLGYFTVRDKNDNEIKINVSRTMSGNIKFKSNTREASSFVFPVTESTFSVLIFKNHIEKIEASFRKSNGGSSPVECFRP